MNKLVTFAVVLCKAGLYLTAVGNDHKFNPSIPPPMVPNPMNTPFNNAQSNQSLQTSSRINKANPPRNPIGNIEWHALTGPVTVLVSFISKIHSIGPNRNNPMQQQHQRMIMQQLQLGVQMENIHPQILNLPLTEQTLRSIQQLLNLQTSYQKHHEQFALVSICSHGWVLYVKLLLLINLPL